MMIKIIVVMTIIMIVVSFLELSPRDNKKIYTPEMFQGVFFKN